MTDSAKIRSGFFWLSSGTILQNLIKIIVIGILSRILTPESFGIITVATSLIGLAELFTQISLAQSLIRLEKLEDTHLKVAFTVSLISGISLCVVFIIFINPLVSNFFEYDGLNSVLDFIVLLFPIHSFSQLSFALLQRQKSFRKIAGLEALSYLVGYGIVAVSLAKLDFGVWSLVYGNLVTGVMYSGLLYYMARFKLMIGFDKAAFKDLFDFGFKYSLIKIVNYGALKGDYFVIGKTLGAVELGIYSRAYALMDSANSMLGKIMHTLLFPIFSTMQNDLEKRRLVLKKVLSVMFNVIIPLSLLVSLYSEYFIKIILGDDWSDAVLIFRVISIGMIGRVGYKILSSVVLGSGSINMNLALQILYLSMVIISVYFSSIYFGLLGAAIAITTVLYFIFLLFVVYVVRSDGMLHFKDVTEASKRGIFLALVLLIVNVGVKFFLNSSELNLFVDLIIIGITNIATLIALLIFKNFFYEEVIVSLIPKRIIKWLEFF